MTPLAEWIIVFLSIGCLLLVSAVWKLVMTIKESNRRIVIVTEDIKNILGVYSEDCEDGNESVDAAFLALAGGGGDRSRSGGFKPVPSIQEPYAGVASEAR